jgi:hypothetical protein
MEITRQHETTTIEELSNAKCANLLGIGPGGELGYYAWYLEANDTWYRFFVQHGILFWDTSAPDPEDDLAEGEAYKVVVDDTWPAESRSIAKIEMDEGILTISFLGNRSLLVRENEEVGGMIMEIT